MNRNSQMAQGLFRKITFLALIILPNLLCPSRLLAQESAFLRVHALNPEGVEIASIEGMNGSQVAIYDNDSHIGYGIATRDDAARILYLSPGAHSIKVEFNGMAEIQDVFLEKGQAASLVFTFPREEFDIIGLLNNALAGSVSYSWDYSFTEGTPFV